MECGAFQEEIHFDLWQKGCGQETWLDRYCSSPYWGIPLQKAFMPHHELVLYRPKDSDSLAVFCERSLPGGRLVLAPDSMWMLGCPLLGDDPVSLWRELVNYWIERPTRDGLRRIVVSGLYPEHPLVRSRFWVDLGGWEVDPSQRMIASLEGGLDGFLSRRSKNFRSRLRRTVKTASVHGFEVESFPAFSGLTGVQALLSRVFSVEERSWKGKAKRGINDGSMRAFYTEMLPLLARHGRLRGLFLTRDGLDYAYLFGGLLGGTFRGLQFSFLDELQLGLGNVCQYHMIAKLASEGCLRYDLGQGMEYKKRWSESWPVSRSFMFQLF